MPGVGTRWGENTLSTEVVVKPCPKCSGLGMIRQLKEKTLGECPHSNSLPKSERVCFLPPMTGGAH